jgi:hypothetical protein
MTQYVHLISPEGKVERVRVGFSWLALLFPLLWAMLNRAWRLAGLLALSYSALATVQLAVGETSWGGLLVALASLALCVACGKYGNAWLVWELKGKGYSET